MISNSPSSCTDNEGRSDHGTKCRPCWAGMRVVLIIFARISFEFINRTQHPGCLSDTAIQTFESGSGWAEKSDYNYPSDNPNILTDKDSISRSNSSEISGRYVKPAHASRCWISDEMVSLICNSTPAMPIGWICWWTDPLFITYIQGFHILWAWYSHQCSRL